MFSKGFFTCMLCIIFVNGATGQIYFQKYTGNPIIPAHQGWSLDPSVLYDGQTGGYKMWYTAREGDHFTIYYATSQDGKNWADYPGNPVLVRGADGAWDSTHVRCGTVLYDGQTYRLYYMGSTTGFDDKIGLATSTDGIIWQKYGGNPIILLGGQGRWDDDRVYHPKAYHDGQTYSIWYAGYDGATMRIGLATSFDGQTFQKHQNNPVLDTGEPGKWDDFGVWPNSGFLFKGDQFMLLYSASDRRKTTFGQIGLATSFDGINWTKSIQNPLLTYGPPGSWDQQGLGSGSLLFKSGKYKLWFSGHTSQTRNWHIGYAESISPGIAGHALEYDGQNSQATINDSNNVFDLDDFTLEAWINRSTQNTFDVILVKGAHGENATVNTNFAIDISNTNVARVIWENAASENFILWGETPIIPGLWYHIAGVRSSRENLLSLYVNGVLDGQLFTIGKPNTQDIPILLGFNGAGFPLDHHFAGFIDEVRIWKKALSGEKVQALMLDRLATNVSTLVGYWRLDEGEGQIIRDLTVYSNHGFLGETPNQDPADPRWFLSTAPLDDAQPVPIERIGLTFAQERDSIFVSWQTSPESNTRGFHLFRSTEMDGPYQQITAEMIPQHVNTGKLRRYFYTDFALRECGTYFYRIAEVDFKNELIFHDPVRMIFELPEFFTLFHNFPNPFNTTTRIRYDLFGDDHIKIEIFDGIGRSVDVLVDDMQQIGSYEIEWGGGRPSGVYFYRLVVDAVDCSGKKYSATKRMVLIK